MSSQSPARQVGCTWCLDFGSLVARFEGVSEDKLRQIHDWENATVFEADERLVLEYADAMTATPMSVDDGLVARLCDVLGEDATVELTALLTARASVRRPAYVLQIPAR